MYEIKLTDKNTITVTKDQADKIMEESATGKAGIVVNDQYLAFKSIYTIKSIDTKPFHELDHKALPSATKSSNYELWIEATKRNRDRMKQGIKPVAYWRVTRNGELIEDPKYYDTVLQGGV